DLWKAREPMSAEAETILRDRVTRLWIESELLRQTVQRARAAQKAGNPGPEGSVAKLAHAELHKRIWECAMDVLGDDALLYEAGFERRRPSDAHLSRVALAKYQFLRSRAN